ncbi:nuclear protein SET [Nitzschia inconspicua]|uniref:Nuclear protein SET n=1 Tax=Nitzschia inconspicua TaxID=303405 RepID=A0A9K3Q0R2_9STRA|nr:nuclear protein SET [Nitzschia inconspicua]
MEEINDPKETFTEAPRRARLYLAPSSHGYGWGVFSLKHISKGDIVELAPLLLRFPEENSEVLKATILNNYHYEYWAWNGVSSECQFALSFGYMLYFNHSAQPNIKYQQFGKEPDVDNPSRAVGLGYYALCDISPHVELLCDYGGPEWFQDRGMTLVAEQTNLQSCGGTRTSWDQAAILKRDSSDVILSSKLCSGYNDNTISKLVESHVDGGFEIPPYNLESLRSRLFSSETQPSSLGFGSVICTENTEEGETLEAVPILVLLKSAVKGSLLETITVEWKDLDFTKDLCPNDIVKVVVSEEVDEDRSTARVRSVTKDVDIHETVLLALAGNLSLLRRSLVGYNSRLVVEHDKYNAYGFLMRLEAIGRIRSGEQVVVKLPEMSSSSIDRVVEELALTGQLVIADLISN